MSGFPAERRREDLQLAFNQEAAAETDSYCEAALVHDCFPTSCSADPDLDAEIAWQRWLTANPPEPVRVSPEVEAKLRWWLGRPDDGDEVV